MKVKNKNWLVLIIKFSFVIFMFLYIMLENGYYENKLSNKIALNEENIRKFENDVKNNKIIDVSNYSIKEEKDYSTKVSKIGQKITDSTGKIIVKLINGIVDILKSLFW